MSQEKQNSSISKSSDNNGSNGDKAIDKRVDRTNQCQEHNDYGNVAPVNQPQEQHGSSKYNKDIDGEIGRTNLQPPHSTKNEARNHSTNES